MAVGQTEARLGQLSAQSAEQAGLAHCRLAHQKCRVVLVDHLAQLGQDLLLRRGSQRSSALFFSKKGGRYSPERLSRQGALIVIGGPPGGLDSPPSIG